MKVAVKSSRTLRSDDAQNRAHARARRLRVQKSCHSAHSPSCHFAVGACEASESESETRLPQRFFNPGNNGLKQECRSIWV